LGVWAIDEVPLAPTIQRQANGEVLLRHSVSATELIRFDATTDLNQWTPLATVPSNGTVSYLDSGAPYQRSRLYRLESVGSQTSFTGDHLATDDGVVTIHPINHASFVMSWNGRMIYNDPVGGAAPYTGLPKADLILVSHSHSDHFHSATLDAVRNTETKILAPQAVFNSMSTTLKGLTTVMANRTSQSLLGLTVEAVPAYNANHPVGAGNGYVVTIGGKRIYISGDTGDIAEMRALPNIDVAFVCMNVPFTMMIAQAVSAVREFKPKIVYPYHFRNQGGALADIAGFKSQVGQDLGIEVRLRTWY
jgi:L-ascorbate metabolism protein UlaG (beta-lactamase superfamily)